MKRNEHNEEIMTMRDQQESIRQWEQQNGIKGPDEEPTIIAEMDVPAKQTMGDQTVILPHGPKKQGMVIAVSGEDTAVARLLDTGREYTVGRGERCDIRFPDREKGISRSHCSILFDGAHFLVTDRSKNGTFRMEGERLPREEPVSVQGGDSLYLAGKHNVLHFTVNEELNR